MGSHGFPITPKQNKPIQADPKHDKNITDQPQSSTKTSCQLQRHSQESQKLSQKLTSVGFHRAFSLLFEGGPECPQVAYKKSAVQASHKWIHLSSYIFPSAVEAEGSVRKACSCDSVTSKSGVEKSRQFWLPVCGPPLCKFLSC